jgi:hypothetical protein
VDVPPVELPVDLPPVDLPPVDVPPVDVPPVEEPPVDVPPVEEPPVDVPPVEEPPVDVPPVEEPPAVDSTVQMLDPTCAGEPGAWDVTFTLRWSDGHTEAFELVDHPSTGLTDWVWAYAGQGFWTVADGDFGCV